MSDAALEKKAQDGDMQAQCSMALLYEVGLDRPQDYSKAAHFWALAARQGSQLAKDKLVALERQGKIPPRPESEMESAPATNSKGTLSTLPNQGLKVLLLEDEDDLREMLSETLLQLGYRPIPAPNGEDGLRLLSQHPDTAVIVTDLKMPRMNGLQFMKAVKALNLLNEPPMVVMTAYSQQKVIDEGKKLGISAWIVKPVRKEMFLETLQKVLKRKQVG